MLGVVLGLCAGWVLLEMAGGSTSKSVLETFGARGPGQGSWRLITSIFLHYGWGHLLINVLSLFALGVAVESIAGSAFFLFVFFFSGVGGGLTSVLVNPQSVSVGASGACYGLLSALLFLLWWAPERTEHLEPPQRSLNTFFLIFLAVMGCKPTMMQGHWADTAQHWGGLLAGFLACLTLTRREGFICMRRGFALALTIWLAWAALVAQPPTPQDPFSSP